MKKSQIAGVESIYIENTSNSQNQSEAYIILHGYGADMTDLLSLTQFLPAGPNRTSKAWYLNGPHTVEIGPHMTGRAWFPLRLAELEQQGFDFRKSLPDGLKKAALKIENVIKEIQAQHQIATFHLVGFSQGSMVALQAAVANPLVSTVTIFSGSLVGREDLLEGLKSRAKPLRFFQSHGSGDPMLPIEFAQELEATLLSGGCDGMLQEFRGGHEIPNRILEDWRSFLLKASPDRPKT